MTIKQSLVDLYVHSFEKAFPGANRQRVEKQAKDLVASIRRQGLTRALQEKIEERLKTEIEIDADVLDHFSFFPSKQGLLFIECDEEDCSWWMTVFVPGEGAISPGKTVVNAMLHWERMHKEQS